MTDPSKPSVAHSRERESERSGRQSPDAGPAAFRAGVKALITARDHVLLQEERRSARSTFWTIPGGGVEPGESLTDSLRRELREELQCAVTVGELVGGCAYSHLTCPDTSVYAVFDVSLLSEPEPNRDEGILRYAWFQPDDLPGRTLDPIQQFVRTTVDRRADGIDDSPVFDCLSQSQRESR